MAKIIIEFDLKDGEPDEADLSEFMRLIGEFGKSCLTKLPSLFKPNSELPSVMTLIPDENCKEEEG